MKVAALLYHDVVAGGRYDASGFTGPGAGVYKIDEAAFRQHLDALAVATHAPPVGVTRAALRAAHDRLPWSLTFDDGGVSARAIGELLAARGWIAHFFITGDRIGTAGFVDAADLRALATQGHVIGAHSWSHPRRISTLAYSVIHEEWQRSIGRLTDILGENVTAASVPGGFYTRRVLDAAIDTGVRVLFNSEPVLRARVHRECLVIGRFSIQRDTPAPVAASFANGSLGSRIPQWLAWNLRKAAKRMGGSAYEQGRERLLRKRLKDTSGQPER